MSASFVPNNSARRPAVTLVVMYFTIGGLERVVVDLANGLVADGVPTRVVLMETGKRNALVTELSPDVDLHCLEGSVAERLVRLRRLCEGRIAHFHFGDGKIRPLCRLALAGHQPLVITYHSVYSHLRGKAKSALDGVLSRQFTKVVAVSERVRTYCVDELGFDAGRVTVVRNGIALPPAPHRADGAGDLSSKPLALVSVGSLYPHKNQATLLQAVALVMREIDVRLTIVGDGPSMAGLVALARELGIHDRVEWHGAMWRREAVGGLLARGDVFVTASTFEGFSIALLEAMAQGLPVVASDIEPHREALGDDGLLVPAKSPEQFCEALLALARDPARRQRLGAASRRRAEQFGVDAFVAEHVRLYESLASAH